LATALIWALTAGSALFWTLRAGGAWTPAGAQLVGGPPPGALAVDARAVGRALGASGPTTTAAAPEVSSRLALRGIVVHGNSGAALIAVDGKPPKPVRVGATLEGIEGGWTLQSVTPRAVTLATGEQQARLEMPLLSERSSASDAIAPVSPPASAVLPSGARMRPRP
jgi:general secretion pathway protein C